MLPPDVRFLLDEHYPAWLADALRDGGIDAAAVVEREDLRGVPDATVLQVATDEHRLVITEDVNTFALAMHRIPEHNGVVFCHHRRFPRNRHGLEGLRLALIAFAATPPSSSSEPSFVWWL